MAAARMSLRRARVVMGACAAVVVLSAAFAPPAAAMRCSHSGAPQNLLSVTADSAVTMFRKGQRIVLIDVLGRARCRGDAPTVLNTDTIRVRSRVGAIRVFLELSEGPFAPGATEEGEGASEIEVELRRDAIAWVDGTRRADEFHWGPGPAHHAGLNLNPDEAGDQDVDVTVKHKPVLLANVPPIVAYGAAGNDTIIPAPGAPFPNDGVISEGGRGNDRLSAPRNTFGLLTGGRGDDVLIGGRRRDDLSGGKGNDRHTGTGGPDLINAGPGRDLIFGGRGQDRINSRDAWRDRARCGAGRDRVKADRRDRLRRCEIVRR